VQVCRNDPVVEVRVLAAEALGGGDEDALAAFRLGLASDDEVLRDRCERTLERLDKLDLPLPDHVYRSVGTAAYERWLALGEVRRQVTKSGFVYFEIVERVGMRPPPGAVCAIGAKRYWYRARVD
jgi:hypothetical protein